MRTWAVPRRVVSPSRGPADRGPADLRQPPRFVERRGTTDIVLQQAIELLAERRIGARGEVTGRQLLDRRYEGFRHEAAAVRAEVSAHVGIASSEDGTVSDGRFRVAQRHSVRSPESAPPAPSSSGRARPRHLMTHPHRTGPRERSRPQHCAVETTGQDNSPARGPRGGPIPIDDPSRATSLDAVGRIHQKRRVHGPRGDRCRPPLQP